MSFEAVLWATSDAPIADVNEFAVLVMLAEKADTDGCNAFPSRPTLAARTRVDSRTVLRCLQRMEERGLIAKGDQRAAEYIRVDRRPVVYDLLIPYSWFPNVERINKERQERGRPPLVPADRPDIAPPPEKKRRGDLGKKRAKGTRGVSQTPRGAGEQNGHGVSLSPPRGVSQSATGCLTDTRTNPLILSGEPLSLSPVVGTAEVARANGAVGEREKSAPPGDKTSTALTEAVVPTQVRGREKRQQQEPVAPVVDPSPAQRVVDAYSAAVGRPVLNSTRTRLHTQATELLAAGFPETWLTDRARELAAHSWTDLTKHAEHSTVPLPGAKPTATATSNGLPPWCGQCGDGMPAEFNPRFRRDEDGQPCPACHPDLVPAHA